MTACTICTSSTRIACLAPKPSRIAFHRHEARQMGPASYVRSPPFNAKGDGSADETASIQAALDLVGRAGGGTVYLRQGQYRVTQLVVPSGVELRGPLGGDSHSFQFVETCTLLATAVETLRTPLPIPR